MNIEQYLNTEYPLTRQELVEKTNLSDRKVRNEISELKQKRAVIYNSQTKGYKLAKDTDTIKLEEIEEEKKAIQHCLNDIESRKRVFNKQERVYIAHLKRLEKKEQELC